MSELATQTPVVIQQRLLAEATIIAYQDYFLLAAGASLLSILPALPLPECWRAIRQRVYAPPVTDVVEAHPGTEKAGRAD
jgi:hypothetical protein